MVCKSGTDGTFDMNMSDKEFRAFLDLLMCSDPWPVTDTGHGDGHDLLLDYADTESMSRGFSCWVDAYHKFNPKPNEGGEG